MFELDRKSQAEVINELIALCKIYSLDAQDLKFKWEAFALNAGNVAPTVKLIRQLKITLQRDFEKSLKATVKGKTATTKRVGFADLSEFGLSAMDEDGPDNSVDSFISNMTRRKPTTTHSASQPSRQKKIEKSVASEEFANRSEKHIIDEQYNAQLPLRGALSTHTQRAHFKNIGAPIPEYRYMFEKMSEKAGALNDRIEYIADLIKDHHMSEDIEFVNPTKLAQESITAYGRICSDASEGKLNEKSILLETSTYLGMGKRIRMNVSRLPEFSFFPGQVVGVQGVNPNGTCFFADKLLPGPIPPKFDSSKLEFVSDGRPIEMLVASGPYTLDTDFSFQPLSDFFNMCIDERPDIVLLMGPFIPSNHSLVTTGRLEMTPQELFEKQVMHNVETLALECPETQIIIQTHASDAFHHFPLFPQPPLHTSSTQSNIHMVSNPARFSINGNVISAVNIDIIFQLTKEELSKNQAHNDRFSRLITHILQQQTYYPLYPHAPGDNIDASQLPNIQVGVSPDILILPSQLKHFVKNVSDIVCINPGHLAKAHAGGTYARVSMYPTDNTQERTRVDLIKL
ncbi:DNA polymerase alpha, subunit B [Backusella circina FSU 941]|nr:DNA polymerase alpha, subunit B [Backusella circina FSU 941]